MTDIDYKKALLRGLGCSSQDYHLLDAVAGSEEFVAFLKKHQNEPLTYAMTDDFTNVRDKTFGANFHIHTTNSDGIMTVSQLLNLAAAYGDSLNALDKDKKFYLAITDHNTTNGTIEALKLIADNPKKYRNIRVVLGVEASAMFTSLSADTTSEVHLLSYGLNPFEDTITKINERRLKIFQYGIKNALNNANVRYIDTISRYGFEFNFEDMAKIRPSIQTCPSNVRYSLKDYLQFRLIFADRVENNSALKCWLLHNGVDLQKLDFAVPKDMITTGTYRPYWRNYVYTLQKYLQDKVTAHNRYASLSEFDELFGHVGEQTEHVLNAMEDDALNPHSDMYIREPKPLSFEEVTNSFAQSEFAVSGVAHGALYEQKNPKRKLFLQELYKNFKEKLAGKDVIGEKHYPYPPEVDYKTADGLIQLYQYVPSGGLDSHKNNFFTPQTSYERDFLMGLVGTTTERQGQRRLYSTDRTEVG